MGDCMLDNTIQTSKLCSKDSLLVGGTQQPAQRSLTQSLVQDPDTHIILFGVATGL